MNTASMTNEELVNYCYGHGDLSPLEIELFHRLEDLMYLPEGSAVPDPEWVQLMFPECNPDGVNT